MVRVLCSRVKIPQRKDPQGRNRVPKVEIPELGLGICQMGVSGPE